MIKLKQILKSQKVFVFVALLFSLFTVHYSLFTWNIFAQQSIPLVVAPARQTVAIDPGKTENLLIKFFNESNTPMSGTIKAVNFYVAGKNGAPILMEDSPNSLVKLPYDRVVIPAGEVLRVNFKVEVPENATPGGSYAAIIFEQTGQLPTPQTEDEAASSVSPRVVGLVSIRINGPVFESAFADVFRLPKFMEFGPIPLYIEILNKGGYHITPKGQITLTDWFGREVERKTLKDKNIFPGAKRVYEEKLGTTWMFGKYKLDLVAAYGESGKAITASQYIWVVPVTAIIATILSILIIILVIYLINTRIKAKQVALETKLEQEITELEALKNKFKDKLPK
jgi:hypothetical protein